MAPHMLLLHTIALSLQTHHTTLSPHRHTTHARTRPNHIKLATQTPQPTTLDATTEPPSRRRKRDVIADALRFRLRRAANTEAEALLSDACDVEQPELCEDESAYRAAIGKLSGLIVRTLRPGKADDEEATITAIAALGANLGGDSMEAGWQSKGSGSALRRTTEVWAFLASAAVKVLKARSDKGKTPEEVSAAKTAAATYIRDSLFTLGPTFVKLGQVISTRTDVVEKEYIAVLKDLQDNVPGFSGAKAKAIISEELGQPVDEVFADFDTTPIAAASLGQVHRATYRGEPVAIKVQRAGLKELFDTDLKNLAVLAKLLDKFDPKSDGADRSYNDIFEESAKLLYEEIDYEAEAANCERFAQSFADVGVDYVKVPEVYRNLTTARILTLEFVPSFKLTDIERVEAEGLDRKLLAKRTAESFLVQILKTSYFHCDPHPGNLCVNREGKLVYYDCGMMNELQPSVARGFKEACLAIFGGGPFISELQLATNAKRLVDALELMGVLAKSADRLAVEKLARYFIKTFKEIQVGKAPANIKQTLGADLQALTESQVFRFPSTFTFIFRAFASIDGIGKGLDAEYDLAKFAQPFITGLTDSDKTELEKFASRFGSATGLRAEDINTAVMQPKKVAYLEQTVRAMEQGTLKIRVRSLENEQALSRLSLSVANTNRLLAGSVLLNLALAGVGRVPQLVWYAGAALCGAQVLAGTLAIKIFDKKAARYEAKDFNTGEESAE